VIEPLCFHKDLIGASHLISLGLPGGQSRGQILEDPAVGFSLSLIIMIVPREVGFDDALDLGAHYDSSAVLLSKW
jgi:hypothetical protein